LHDSIAVWKLNKIDQTDAKIDWTNAKLIYSDSLDVGYISRLPKSVRDAVLKEKL